MLAGVSSRSRQANLLLVEPFGPLESVTATVVTARNLATSSSPQRGSRDVHQACLGDQPITLWPSPPRSARPVSSRVNARPARYAASKASSPSADRAAGHRIVEARGVAWASRLSPSGSFSTAAAPLRRAARFGSPSATASAAAMMSRLDDALHVARRPVHADRLARGSHGPPRTHRSLRLIAVSGAERARDPQRLSGHAGDAARFSSCDRPGRREVARVEQDEHERLADVHDARCGPRSPRRSGSPSS